MEDLACITARGACGLIEAGEVGCLGEIARPGIAAVIWQRQGLSGMLDRIASLKPAHLPALRQAVPLHMVRSFVGDACAQAGLRDKALRTFLADDVEALAREFVRHVGKQTLEIRLEPVTTDSCRRFHVDHVRARLLCTYRGTGTELAIPGESGIPRRVRAGDVAFLRGALWSRSEEVLVRHRSPPIAGTGETRLLLAINPVVDED